MTRDLVQRAQQGDSEAFEALVRAAYDRLYATAHRILRDRDTAEDAVQDAIVRCWRDVRGLRDPDRFEAWLYRLLVNACRDLSRRARRQPSVPYQQEAHLGAATDEYATIVDHDALEQAFLSVPTDQRIALVLTHYVGYSAPEVAAILGIPTGTVYSRIHYGARAMRGALSTSNAMSGPSTESSR